jgi:hypothetical protein
MNYLLNLLPKTVFACFFFLAASAFVAGIAFVQLGYPGATGIEVFFLVIGLFAFALVVKRIYDIRKAYKQGRSL